MQETLQRAGDGSNSTQILAEATRAEKIELDKELIRCVIEGDPTANQVFVDRFGRLIFRILNQMDLPRDMVDDLYPQVFVHLWEDNYRRLRQWRGQSRFTSFLGVVAARLARDLARSGRTTSVLREDHLVAPDPIEQVLKQEESAAVLSALENLSARDREIIRLRHYEGLSYREIAEKLHITVNNVGVALARAEKRLAEALQKQAPSS